MLTKRKILVFLLVLVLMLPGCSLFWPAADQPPVEPITPNEQRHGSFMPTVIPVSGEDAGLRTVYLLDHSSRYLVPYVLSVRKTEGIAREVLKHLVANPDNEAALHGTEFLPPLPTATTILGMTIRDQLAIVDFSSDFLAFRDANHERLAIDAVVYTLTEFDTVDRVELRVEGHPLTTLPSGLPLPSPCSRADRPLNFEVSPAVTDLATGTKVRLYFSAVGPAGGLIYFVPVTRQIPVQNDHLAAAILELIQGPLPASGLYADIPANTELRSVKLIGDVAHVDFSASLTDYGGGTAAENAMLGALVLTLTDIPGVNRVKITINGQTPILPEGTDVSQPVLRPLFVNPFIL
ncbi:MAG: hypothetical protein GX060_01615 [Firmicutes bacterium]|nr:hypothetical protein [Bacillota bacterium]